MADGPEDTGGKVLSAPHGIISKRKPISAAWRALIAAGVAYLDKDQALHYTHQMRIEATSGGLETQGTSTHVTGTGCDHQLLSMLGHVVATAYAAHLDLAAQNKYPPLPLRDFLEHVCRNAVGWWQSPPGTGHSKGQEVHEA